MEPHDWNETVAWGIEQVLSGKTAECRSLKDLERLIAARFREERQSSSDNHHYTTPVTTPGMCAETILWMQANDHPGFPLVEGLHEEAAAYYAETHSKQ
ncbi:hypothetical protein HYX70_03100 [Candidatus Saccharibacteria bacterium]|nr:hypothetical protein [Candidatus Saccharibacteria bacterium]